MTPYVVELTTERRWSSVYKGIGERCRNS